MKKISIISILSVLVMPAFAQTETKNLYGDPANIQQDTMLNTEVPQASEEQPVDSKEVKGQKVEEKKAEKKTTQKAKTSQSKEKQTQVQEQQQIEQPKIEEQKFKSKPFSNPDTKFPHGLQLGLGVSPTSGLNAFVGYNNKNFDSFWWKRLGFRLDFATYSPIKSTLNSRINNSIGDDGIKIDDNLKVNNVDINAKHIAALVDFYPFGDTWFLGGLRVSGGYMSGNLDLNADIKGKFDGTDIEFELGGQKYKYAGNEMQGKANINWKYSGPYIGTGFDLGIFRGFKLYFDAGVVFTDNHAKADLNVPTDNLKTIGGVDVSPNSTIPEVQAAYAQYEDAKAKAVADAQNELNKVDYYPIVKLGLMYRF